MNSSIFFLNGTPVSLATATIKQKQEWILKNLSYSTNLTLHRCSKKWQIEKLGGAVGEDEEPGSVTFAYGHAVGAGLQTLFLPGKTLNDAYLAAFMAWDIPLSEELPKKKKSFWYVLRALELAQFLVKDVQSEGWELAYFGEIPGIEFSYTLELPDGFYYRAHVDLILRHRVSGKYRIVECKTSGFSDIHEASFANSSQALSYSLMLDHLVKFNTAYDVLYFVWSCPAMQWVQLPFTKSALVKAEWIRDILYDCETIKGFLKTNYFPKRGEACYDFFRPCEFYGACGYGDQFLGVQQHETLDRIIQKELQNTRIDANNKRGYDIHITLNDLLRDRLLHLGREKVAL